MSINTQEPNSRVRDYVSNAHESPWIDSGDNIEINVLVGSDVLKHIFTPQNKRYNLK